MDMPQFISFTSTPVDRHLGGYIFKKFILAALGLHCSVQALHCGIQAFLVGERGLSSARA